MVSRTQAVTALIEAEKIFALDSAPFVEAYIGEMAAFPMAITMMRWIAPRKP